MKNIARWLGHGKVGASSKCMALTALGAVPMHRYHPADPSDLMRCILLLDAAPEVRDAFPVIREISPQWAVIIDNWDALRDMLIDEVGMDWCNNTSAPLTWGRMKSLFKMCEVGK